MKAIEVLCIVYAYKEMFSKSGVYELEKNVDLTTYFRGITGHPGCVEKSGIYFWFYAENDVYNHYLRRFLRIACKKYADYELPDEKGWYALFKIEK